MARFRPMPSREPAADAAPTMFLRPLASSDEAELRRIHRTVGFRAVGVMRSYECDNDGAGRHDSLLMELLAGEERGAATTARPCRVRRPRRRRGPAGAPRFRPPAPRRR
jgi:hypothetical protein